MDKPEKALASRIRQLRRRHFGPRGKARFAEKLGISLQEYERYERGALPPGELMVRMCEATGEDLQWLLTGVPARGTVVISGTRRRHQDLLARLARALDQRPELAAPIEALLDLLTRREVPAPQTPRALLTPPREALIPILEPHELPQRLPAGPPQATFVEASDQPAPGSLDLVRWPEPIVPVRRRQADLAEPAVRYESGQRTVEVVTVQAADGSARDCIHSTEITRCLPNAFAARVTDDSMRPMFLTGDAVLVVPGVGPKVGRPALCRLADDPGACCRIWLGDQQGLVQLGRLADGETEALMPEKLLWSLEILFRLARAA